MRYFLSQIILYLYSIIAPSSKFDAASVFNLLQLSLLQITQAELPERLSDKQQQTLNRITINGLDEYLQNQDTIRELLVELVQPLEGAARRAVYDLRWEAAQLSYFDYLVYDVNARALLKTFDQEIEIYCSNLITNSISLESKERFQASLLAELDSNTPIVVFNQIGEA